MSEKRRPDKVIVAEKQGKTKWIRNRMELFSERQWAETPGNHRGIARYRIRMNGKWVTQQRYWTMSEIMAQTRKWLLK